MHGRERLLARSLGGRLARLELESRVASGGGDEGGGWEPPGPITDPRAPPQCSPPRTGRLGGGGTSSAPHPPRGRRLWDYKSRQSLLKAWGPRRDRGHGPRTSTTPSPLIAILSVPFWSHGNYRHFTKPGRWGGVARVPWEGMGRLRRTHRLPSPCKTPPEGLKQ